MPSLSGETSGLLIFNSSNSILASKLFFVFGSINVKLYVEPNDVFLKNIKIASISPSNKSSGLKSGSYNLFLKEHFRQLLLNNQF